MSGRAGMKKELDVETGLMIRESSWGSATINGISLSKCAKIIEYSDGWVFKAGKAFGGGLLWMPKRTTTIGEVQKGGIFIPSYQILKDEENIVRVFGKLSNFIHTSSPAPDS